MTDYVPDHQDLTMCPNCGSGRLVCLVQTETSLDACLDCARAWERLPVGEPFTTDGEQLPFKRPCDNCAFRRGSQERQDPDVWAALQYSLALEGRFYCHKAVPFKVDAAPAAGEKAFEFPRKAGSVTVEGTTHAYQQYDLERMRLCRGYLNAHVNPKIRRLRDEA